MSITSEQELKRLYAVGRAVRAVLDEMQANVRPGVTTKELDAVSARVLAKHGARHAPRHRLGFPGDSCISVNDEAVHGIPGDRMIVPGDLVKLDVVAEKDGYFADAAVTVAVAPVSDEKARLVACAESAFAQAMKHIRAGVRVADIGRAVEAEVVRYGFRVMRDLAGHGTGRAIHEPPHVFNYYEPKSRDILTEGLVLTVEPIVAATSGRAVQGEDGWTILTADGGLSSHFEQTLVVTKGEPIIVTAA